MINYKIAYVAKSRSSMDNDMEKTGTRNASPASGRPRVTVGWTTVETEVTTAPDESVIMNVIMEGVGEMAGSAETLGRRVPNTAL